MFLRNSNNNKRKALFIFSFFVLIILISTFLYNLKISSAATNGCYQECNLTDPKYCVGNKVFECQANCDSDHYQDFCEVEDCSLTGKVCVKGVCIDSSSTCSDGTPYNTCSTNTGVPWYCNSSGNLVENCGECGCSGSWVCGPSNTFCCDNQCNGSCSPSGCTVAQDPDCGCQDGNGCCGIGCNSSNDSDCGGTCTDECSSGQVGCNGNTPWYCGEANDGDSCLDKINKAACVSPQICDSNTGTCTNNSGSGSVQGSINLIRTFPIGKSENNNPVKLALAKNSDDNILDKENKIDNKGKVLGVQEKKNISKNIGSFFQDKLSVEPSSFPENSFLTIKFISKLAYQDIFEIKTSIRDKKNNQIIKVYNNKKYFALYNNGKHNDNLKNDHNWAVVIDTAKLNLVQGEYQINLSVIPLNGKEKTFSTTFKIKNPAKLIKGKDYLDDQLIIKFFPHTFEMPFDLSEVKVDSKDFQKLTIPDSVDKLIKDFKVTKIKRAFTLSKKEIKEYKENPTVVKEKYNIYTFIFNKDIDINALKQVFQKDKNIIYVDFNGKIHLSYIPSNEYYNKNFNTSTHTYCEFSYQDPLYSNGENRTIVGQWGLKRIGMEKAWDIFHNYSITPKVLLVDASLSDHWSGHATHMRGTITSYRSLSCQGVPDETAGIIDRSNVVDASITIDTDMIATINAMYNYLITNGHYNNINVINMSWGYSNFDQNSDNMLQEIYDKGIILIAAAGNNTNGFTTNIDYPAASDYVMAVSASTPEDEVASFSQTKKWTATGIEVAAPGTYIISDRYKNAENYYGSDSSSPGFDDCIDWPTDCSIIFKGGDSMSSAMTSGVAGLIYSVGGFTSKTKQTSDRVRKIIKFTSDDIENDNIYGGIDSKAGYGRINAERALTFLKDGKIGIKSLIALYKNISDFNSSGFDEDCSDGLCYVVTDAKTGSYNLSNIPNGTYKIVSWIADYENSNVDTVLPGSPFSGANLFCSIPQDITISGSTQKNIDFDIDNL